MSITVERLKQFVNYVHTLDGDEKGEAQVFCDRLFRAFGHDGYKEAGATLEYRVKKQATGGTSFADLMWKPRVLIEMKKRGENLSKHYRQAFDYWLNSVPNRPRYVVLCNFDEFRIYDFDYQLDEPVDTVLVENIHFKYPALNFLYPEDLEPTFGNDNTAVSVRAAEQMAKLFVELVSRKKDPVSREVAQRFVLQLVVAMFSGSIDLIPASTVANIVRDCLEKGQNSYDLFGSLFRQMNTKTPAKSGRYKGVPYFNGGLFSKVDAIELTRSELNILGWSHKEGGAATENWSKVNPAIFGTLFEQSMDSNVQHRHGRHFTSEADIQRVVGPTLVHPWSKRVSQAETATELRKLRTELSQFRVLDPACGSGNFLYVAFRELARIDLQLMRRLQSEFSRGTFQSQAKVVCAISPKQFFGLDNDAFGVELAKVTLMLAKKLAFDEALNSLSEGEHEYAKGTKEFEFEEDQVLPLDNLDENIKCVDALFESWPPVELIVGNPPFQSKNKAQEELSPAYLSKVRKRHSGVSGLADYCVYWFRIAHDHLKPGQRAGLVGTNTVRQNNSREGGLDYITANGGTLLESVSSMIWPGTAVVHVSIANWIKGVEAGQKRLHIQEGNDVSTGWRHQDFDIINSSLSFTTDVSKAKKLKVNAKKGGCFQGQTHGNEGFLIEASEAKTLLAANPDWKKVLRPFLIADDLIGHMQSSPSRYVIDFSHQTLLDAEKFGFLFQRVKKHVLPAREKAAIKEAARNKQLLSEDQDANVNTHHASFLAHWWQMSYSRQEMMRELVSVKRYIVCGRVTKRPIFDFVDSGIQPNDALTVFPFEDDYSFGILQSDVHWDWFVARCSTLKADPRYTSNTVFDSFPWPQDVPLRTLKKVAKAGVRLRTERRRLRDEHGLSLRELYRRLEGPGENSLKACHVGLDTAVRAAYGMKPKEDSLNFLLKLNHKVSAAEAGKSLVNGPGLPEFVDVRSAFITTDAVKVP